MIAAAARRLPLRPLFITTLFSGSFLLFLVQPLFGRIVLPVLGGSPSVWNTAMLFYQAALLAGYVYADWLQRLPVRRQLLLHLGLFAAARSPCLSAWRGGSRPRAAVIRPCGCSACWRPRSGRCSWQYRHRHR